MTITHDRPPAVAPTAPSRESSLHAWMAVVLAPFVAAGAAGIGFAIDAWWGDLITLCLIAIPILAGFALGVRAARAGNGSGALAAATAAAEALFITMLLIGANVIDFSSDGTSAGVGIGAAVAAFVVTEVVLYRMSRAVRGERDSAAWVRRME